MDICPLTKAAEKGHPDLIGGLGMLTKYGFVKSMEVRGWIGKIQVSKNKS